MDGNWGRPPYYGHPDHPGQLAGAAPGGASLFGAITKANKGILKNPIPQAPNPGASMTVPAMSQQMPGFVAQQEPTDKHEAFMQAKTKIEQIQKGLWKSDSRESNPGMSSDSFKMPHLPTRYSKASQGVDPGLTKPAVPLVEYEEEDRPDVLEDDDQCSFSRQKALEEIDRYRSVARANRENASRVQAENRRGSYREPAEDRRGSYWEPVHGRDGAYKERDNDTGDNREPGSGSRYERDYDNQYDRESSRDYKRYEERGTYRETKKEYNDDEYYDSFRQDRYSSRVVDRSKDDHESLAHNKDSNRKTDEDKRFREHEKDYSRYSPDEVESMLADKSRFQEYDKSNYPAEFRDRYRDETRDTYRYQANRRLEAETGSTLRQEQTDDTEGNTKFEVFDYGHKSESDKITDKKDINVAGRVDDTDRDIRDRERRSDSNMDRDYSKREYDGNGAHQDHFGNRTGESQYQKRRDEDLRQTRDSYGNRYSRESSDTKLDNKQSWDGDQRKFENSPGQDRDERTQNLSHSRGGYAQTQSRSSRDSFTENQSPDQSRGGYSQNSSRSGYSRNQSEPRGRYTQNKLKGGFSQNHSRGEFSQNKTRERGSQNQSRGGFSENQSRDGYSGNQARVDHPDDTRDSNYDARNELYGQDYQDSALGHSDDIQDESQDVGPEDIYPADEVREANDGKESRFEGIEKGDATEKDKDFRKRQNSGDMLYEDFIFAEDDEKSAEKKETTNKPVSKDSQRKEQRSTEGSNVQRGSRRTGEDRYRRSTSGPNDKKDSKKFDDDKRKSSVDSHGNKDSRKLEDDRNRRSDNTFVRDSRKSVDDRIKKPKDSQISHTQSDSKKHEEDKKKRNTDRSSTYNDSKKHEEDRNRRNTESSRASNEPKKQDEDRNRDKRSSKDNKSREEDRKRRLKDSSPASTDSRNESDRKRRYVKGSDVGNRSPNRNRARGGDRDRRRDYTPVGLDDQYSRTGSDTGWEESPGRFRQTRWSDADRTEFGGTTMMEDGQLVGNVIQPLGFDAVGPTNFGLAKPVYGPGILCKDCNIACLDTEVYEAHLQSDSHILVLQKKAQELFQMAGASTNAGRFSPGEPFPSNHAKFSPRDPYPSDPGRFSPREPYSMAPVVGPVTPPPLAPVIPPKPKGPLQFKSIGCSSLNMSWGRLTGADRKAVEKYVVEYRNARETEWITFGTTDRNDYTVDGLQESTDYLFRVYAINGEEKGEVLESVLITTGKKKERAISPVRQPPTWANRGRGRGRGQNAYNSRGPGSVGCRSHLDRNRDRNTRTSQERDRKSSQDRDKDRDKDRKSNQDKDKDRSQKSSKERDKEKLSQQQKSNSRDKSSESKSDKKKDDAKSDTKNEDDKSSKDISKVSADKKDSSNANFGKKGDEKDINNKGVDKKGSDGDKMKKMDKEKVEEVVEIVEDVECLLYKEIPKIEEQPLLGLEYLWEIVSYKPTVPVRYLCKLCNTKGFSSPAMIKHVTALPHKMEFFKKYNMTTYDTISMITPRKDQLERINYEGRLVEDQVGRGAVKVMIMLNPEDTDGKVKFKDPVEVKAPAPDRSEVTKETPPDSIKSKSKFREIFDETVRTHELEDIALIGMSYLKEFLHPTDEKQLPRYTCSLCSIICTDKTVVFHMIGKKHRLAYLKVHLPDFWRMTTNCPDGKLQVVNKAKEIEAKQGSGELKCLVAKNARLWRPNVKAKDIFADDEEESSAEGAGAGTSQGTRPAGIVAMEKMAAEEKEESGGIKFGIRKADPTSKPLKAVNVLEEVKPKSKEAFDWTKENAILQEKIQNQTIIKSSRKSKFITVYSEFFKRYPVIGLQWVTEFQKPDPKMEPWYMCFMCQQKLQWKNILDHVTCSTHRINYMKKNYETKYQSLLNTINTNKTRGRAIIESYSREIMRQENPVSNLEVMLELNINKEVLKSVMKVKDDPKSTASSTLTSSAQTASITTTSTLCTTLVTTSSTVNLPVSSITSAGLAVPGTQTVPLVVQQPTPQLAAANLVVSQPPSLMSKTVYPYMPPEPSHPAVFSTMSVASRQMPGVNNTINPANRFPVPRLNTNFVPPNQSPNQLATGQGLQPMPGQTQNMYSPSSRFPQQQVGVPGLQAPPTFVAGPTGATPRFRSQPPWQRANTATHQPAVNASQLASLKYATGLPNTTQIGTNQILPNQTGLQQQIQTGNYQTGVQATSQTGYQPSQIVSAQTGLQQQLPTGSQSVTQNGPDKIQKVVEKQAEQVLTQQILKTGQFPSPGTTKVSLASDNQFKSKQFAQTTNQTGDDHFQRGVKRSNWGNEQKGAFGDNKRTRMMGRGWKGPGSWHGRGRFDGPENQSGSPFGRGKVRQDFNRQEVGRNYSDQAWRQDNWGGRSGDDFDDFDDDVKDMHRESEERYDAYYDDQDIFEDGGRDMYDTSVADDYNVPLSSREAEDLVQMYNDRTDDDYGEFDLLEEEYRQRRNSEEYLDDHHDDFADQQSHRDGHPDACLDDWRDVEDDSFRRPLDSHRRFDQRENDFGDEYGRHRYEPDEREQEDFQTGMEYRDQYNDEESGNFDEVDEEVDQYIDDRQQEDNIDNRDEYDMRENRESAPVENRFSNISRREHSDERDLGHRNRNRDDIGRRSRHSDLRDRSPRSPRYDPGRSRSDDRSARSRSHDRDRSRRDRNAGGGLDKRSRSRQDRSRKTERGRRNEESRSGRPRDDDFEQRSRSSRFSGGDRGNSRSESPLDTAEDDERWSREPESEDPSREEIDMLLRKVNTSLMKMPEEIRESIRTDVAREMPRVIDKLDQVFPSGRESYEEPSNSRQSGSPLGRNQKGARGGQGSEGMSRGRSDFDFEEHNLDDVRRRGRLGQDSQASGSSETWSDSGNYSMGKDSLATGGGQVNVPSGRDMGRLGQSFGVGGVGGMDRDGMGMGIIGLGGMADGSIGKAARGGIGRAGMGVSGGGVGSGGIGDVGIRGIGNKGMGGGNMGGGSFRDGAVRGRGFRGRGTGERGFRGGRGGYPGTR